MRIILASGSPRRRELLNQLGLPHEVLVPNVNEDAILAMMGPGPFTLSRVAETVSKLAVLKADQISFQLAEEPALVIGADTVVVLDGRILGKPSSRAHARRMLRSLSGRSHQVMTGLAVLQYPGPYMQVTTALTNVRFRVLTEAIIDAYVQTGEPMDKAGAYGIQARGGALVEAIHGCYFNVVGLPLFSLCKLLEGLDFPVWTLWEKPSSPAPPARGFRAEPSEQ